MGTERAVKMLQEILGVPQDAVIGPQTLAEINNYNGDLVDVFLDAREARSTNCGKRSIAKCFFERLA